MQEASRSLKRDGLSLTAMQYGDSSAPAVVLLHGFPDTPYSWDKLVPILVQQGYQVLTPWLRGYTRGSASRHARYDLLAVAGDIEAWRQELLVDEVHLVGHDWGAAVANVISGRIQARAAAWSSISLLAVPPMPSRGDWLSVLPYVPKQLLYSAYMPRMQANASYRVLSKNNADYVERLWRRWSPNWNFSEPDIAAARMVFCDPELAWASTRYYRNLFRWHDANVRQALSAMAKPFVIPTLALAGRDDGCMDMRTHQALGHAAQKRGLHHAAQLDGCGHFLHAERPDEVAQTLLKHFRVALQSRSDAGANQEGFAVSA